jgi:hypothetical protein
MAIYSAAVGYAGTDARTVEVEDADGLTTHGLESPLGVFVVVADGTAPATARIRTKDGRVLLEHELGRRPHS